MKKILLSFWIIGSVNVYSQCNIDAIATTGITLTGPGMANTAMAVAYNPDDNLYYSVGGGGSGMTVVTFDNTGTQVSTASPTNFDHRGMWWNPNLNQLESNGYYTFGIKNLDLAANGYALSSGSNIFSANQPDNQSMGKLDYDDNEIIYYSNSRIYRKSRVDNSSLSDYPIIGLPVVFSNLEPSFVGYTGCIGKEIIVYDKVTRAVYFIDKSTGAYVGTSSLPASAPITGNWHVSFTNEQLFLEESNEWFGFNIFEQCSNTQNAFNVNVCDAYTTPSGNATYMTSGVYNDTIPNATGCDSIMTITVNVTTLDLNTTTTGFTISANNASGTYQWINCSDNLPIASETNQTYTANSNGDYAVIITNGPCSDTSACVNIAGVGINEVSDMGISIYPNPTNGQFYVSSINNDITITVYSVDGKIIINNLKVNNSNQQIDLGKIKNGFYFVKVSNDISKETIRLIVK